MFENIVGHEKQKEILSKNIENGNISHSYLFFGNSGIGKKKIAYEFAKKILNTDNLENNPDFKVISKREDKKDILVEQIRKEIIDDIYIVPATGTRKVYIIDDAQNLNIAAQNSLLKTLEEPPKYVVIILIATNISSFLSTILSRVNQIAFTGISSEELNHYINTNYNVNLNANILEFIEGSIGKAIDIIQNNVIEKLDNVDKLYSCIDSLNTIATMKVSNSVDFNNSELLEYLEFILYKNNKYNCIKIVENAKSRLKSNGNYDIIIDSMLLRLIDNIKEV